MLTHGSFPQPLGATTNDMLAWNALFLLTHPINFSTGKILHGKYPWLYLFFFPKARVSCNKQITCLLASSGTPALTSLLGELYLKWEARFVLPQDNPNDFRVNTGHFCCYWHRGIPAFHTYYEIKYIFSESFLTRSDILLKQGFWALFGVGVINPSFWTLTLSLW